MFKVNIEKLSGWRLLFIFIVPYFTIIIYFFYVSKSPAFMNNLDIFMLVYILLFGLVYIGWFFFLEGNINNRDKSVNYWVYVLCLISIVATILSHLLYLVIIFFSDDMPFEDMTLIFSMFDDNLLLGSLNTVSSVAVIYAYLYIAKRVVSFEKGREVSFMEYVRLFLILYFLPIINVFVIHRKIAQALKESTPIKDKNSRDLP